MSLRLRRDVVDEMADGEVREIDGWAVRRDGDDLVIALALTWFGVSTRWIDEDTIEYQLLSEKRQP